MQRFTVSKAWLLFLFLVGLAITTANVQAEDILYVAGTRPSERPASAPVITEVSKDAQWYDNALHGITKPYPYSLHFLEDQGNWFTPFVRPGMPPPYDIRNWYSD